MAEFDYIQNGVKTAKNGRRKRRRRNPATAAAVKPLRRNGTTKAGALSYAKKNGLKLVSRSAANPKRRRRGRRNGVTVMKRNNGILGNTKHDAIQVASLLGGMAATKIVSRLLSNFAAPFAAQLGVGDYLDIILDLGVGLTVIPIVGGKVAGPNGKQMARLGAMAVVGLDLVNKFAPQYLGQLNPFSNVGPLVLNGTQPLLTPPAVAAIIASTDASPEAKAKVAGAMRAIQSGGRFAGAGQRRLNQRALYS